MSHFSQTLNDFIRSPDGPRTQAELVRRTGIDKALLSRILLDKQAPDAEQVAIILAGCGGSSEDRAKLLVAHLRDEAAPSFQRAGLDERRVKIEAKGDDPDTLGEPVSWWETAPAGLVIQLEILGKEGLRSKPLENLIGALSEQVLAAQRERMARP